MTGLNLDVRTVMFLLFTGNVASILIVAAYARGRWNRAYGQFLAGRLLQVPAWAFLALRGQIPDALSVLGGNILLFCGFALEAAAMTAPGGDSRFWEKAYAGVVAAASIIFIIMADAPNTRVAYSSVGTILIFATMCGALLKTRSGSMLRLTIGLLGGIMCVILSFRVAFALSAPSNFTIFTGNTVQTLAFLAAFLLLIVGGVGFPLMTKEYADRLLAESEEKYRMLVEQSNDGIAILQDGVLVFTNRRLREFLGVPKDSGDALPALEMVHPDDRATVQANYDKRVSGIEPVGSYDLRVNRRDGKLLWVSMSACRIMWKGRPASMGMMSDITERKKLEAEREKNIADLKTAISEIKTLTGLLPICAACKKIRNDNGYWQQVESYLVDHTDAMFSHSICPDCAKILYPEFSIGKSDKKS